MIKRVKGLQNQIVGLEMEAPPHPEVLLSIGFVREALHLSFSVPWTCMTALKFNQKTSLILSQKKLVQHSQILNPIKQDRLCSQARGSNSVQNQTHHILEPLLEVWRTYRARHNIKLVRAQPCRSRFWKRTIWWRLSTWYGVPG